MFEQCKCILKCYLKVKNVTEVQRLWRNEFGTSPSTHITIARLHDKSEADGTVHNMNKGWLGRP
jgi:hypothetical protein